MSAGALPDSLSARPAVVLRGNDPRGTDVLLVEDDDLVRHALKWLLGSDRRECVAVPSAEEAQQLLAVHEPALVVTDLNLRDIPMLLMTGDNPGEARSRLAATGLGHVALLSKPSERAELQEMLARLIGGTPDRHP